MTVIIDTGCANLTSLQLALKRLGCQARISHDREVITQAPRVLLPGVGNAAYAMAELKERGLDTLIPSLQQPTLGICLGMQLLMERSAEGNEETLDIIPGKVEALDTQTHRLPHMGWNTISQTSDHPLFTDIPQNSYFYFVHSFAVPVISDSVAVCDYSGLFSAAIARDNFMGVQFHPERSGKAGAQVLQNFLEIS